MCVNESYLIERKNILLQNYAGKNGKDGLNMAGQILMKVRDNQYPAYFLLGDSLVRDVQIEQSEKCSVPGGNIAHIKTLSPLLSVLPKTALILQFGTNDMVPRDEPFANPIKVPKNLPST